MRRKMKFIALLLLHFFGFYCNSISQDFKKTAIVNINLVPMTNNKIIMDQIVIIENGKIIEIGNSYNIKIPKNIIIIKGKGGYLMPGLADMHMHFTNESTISLLNLYLANGVTTIRSLNGSPNQLRLRDNVKKGKRDGPTIYLSGPIIDGGDYRSGRLIINSPEKVREEIFRQKSAGYDFIKLYTFLSKEVYFAAIKAAKEANMYTVGHISYSVGLDGVIATGMDEVAHIEELLWEFLDKFDRSDPNPFGQKICYKKFNTIMSRVKKSKIKLCTTLAIDDVIVQKITTPEKYLNHPEAKYLSRRIYSQIASGKDHHQVIFAKGKEMLDWIKWYKKILVEAKKLDVPLVIGTDAGAFGVIHGFSLHDELRILIENGFTPYDAISLATRCAAEAINKQDEWGTIEVGKRADLILVKKNPLKNIKNIKDKYGVMAAGKWYTENQLQKMVYLEAQK